MNQFLTLIVLLAVAVPTAAPIGAAQDTANNSTAAGAVQDAQNATETTTETEERGRTGDSGGKVIDEDLRLVSWEYDWDDEKFVLVYESDRPKRVTMTEAVQMEEGSGDGTMRQTTVSSGRTTVNLSISPVAEQAAVFITTSKTVDENRFVWVSTGQTETDRPAVSWQTVQLLLLGAVGLTSGTIFRVIRKKAEDEEKEAERIL